MCESAGRAFLPCGGPPPLYHALQNKWKIGMRPETRQTVVNMVMLAAAFAVVTVIILMRPAARVAREPAAQSAALSAATMHAPASR